MFAATAPVTTCECVCSFQEKMVVCIYIYILFYELQMVGNVMGYGSVPRDDSGR